MVTICLGIQATPFEVNGVWYDYVTSDQKECFVTGAPYGEPKSKGDVVIPSYVEYKGEMSKVVCITNYAFRDCKELVSVEIPPTVNRIYNYAFQGSGIQKITIPSTVTTFEICYEIQEVTSLSTNPQPLATSGGALPFYSNVYQNATLHVPAQALTLYQSTSGWKEFQHIEGDAATGIAISQVDNLTNSQVDIYDLQGRKVNGMRLPDGIYIVNGKKILLNK